MPAVMVKAGNVRLRLCDLIRQVTFCSSQMGFHEELQTTRP